LKNRQGSRTAKYDCPRKKPTVKKNIPQFQREQHHETRGGENPNATKRRIRKLLSRILHPVEVDFLLAIWKAGNIRAADCPTIATSPLRRGWVERDGHTVHLSEQTKRLLAENVE
jgi:hypothetical protein